MTNATLVANGDFDDFKISGTTGSGKTAAFLLIASSFTITDTDRGRRIRGLLDELADVHLDFEMAYLFSPLTVLEWLPALRVEERDVLDHLYEAVTTG
jgi:hypothetical protein